MTVQNNTVQNNTVQNNTVQNKNDAQALLALEDLSIGYHNEAVLSGIDLHINKGDIACILGPSGSGKTSILRAIAGFIDVSDGQISINDQVVSSKTKQVEPSKRGIGLVFQDFALFPHLTVKQNVEFGLQKLKPEERLKRSTQYMEIMGIVAFADKYPADLSGGQQQRVAIARAIAPQPDLLLMDEAFSSLDPSLRQQIAQDMRKTIRKLGLTAILVTHEQSEAFAFADKIAVVAEGKLQQFSNAYDLYHEPETFFVANFIGEGAFIKAKVHSSEKGYVATTALGDIVLTKSNTQTDEAYAEGQVLRILLRPDDVIHDDASVVKATVDERQFRGAFIRYELKLASTQERVICFAPSHHDHEVGESFGIRAEVEHVISFSQDTGSDNLVDNW